jgi:hypothetical protein
MMTLEPLGHARVEALTAASRSEPIRYSSASHRSRSCRFLGKQSGGDARWPSWSSIGSRPLGSLAACCRPPRRIKSQGQLFMPCPSLFKVLRSRNWLTLCARVSTGRSMHRSM